MGDDEGAALALDGLIHAGLERLRHPILWVQASSARGLLDIEAGREAAGRSGLTRFLDCWGAADWELPEVVEARAQHRPRARHLPKMVSLI